MKKTISELSKTKTRKGAVTAVEIEACFENNIDVFIENKDWRSVSEGSLRGNGIEYILRTPSTKKILKEKIENLYKQDKFRFFIPSTRAGIHVHENFTDKTLEEVFIFLSLFWSIEPLIVKYFGGEERENNLFCLQLHQADHTLELLKKLCEENFRWIRDNYNNYKYSSCNIAALATLGTIEFRFLPSYNNSENLLKFIDFLSKLRQEAEKYSTFDELADKFQDNYEKTVLELLNKLLPSNFIQEHENNIYKNMGYIDLIPGLLDSTPIRKKQKNTKHGKDFKIYHFPTNEEELDTIY